jgi:hypothetical protein
MRPIGGDTEAFIASFTDDAYLVDYNGTGDIVSRSKAIGSNV